MSEKVNSFLMKVMQRIRKKRLEEKKNEKELTKPNLYFEENRYEGRPYLMPLYVLKTRPCSWFSSGGGCTTCGYQWAASLEHPAQSEQILEQVEYVKERTPSDRYPFVTVTSSGSFLDPQEMDDITREKILKKLREYGYEFFNFECRPEYTLAEERLEMLNRYFKGAVSVGIGLESKSDFIRINCMHKGFRQETFEEASRTLKKHNISYDIYTLLGKPFLTERESIQDAYETLMYGFEQGAHWGILMIANLQPYTLTHWLWKRDQYELPWLWSAIEILERLPKKYRERVIVKGMYRAVPSPDHYARNCERCTIDVIDAFNKFSLTGDYEHINEVKNFCDCKQEWRKKIEGQPEKDLKPRVREYYEYIADNLFDEPPEIEIVGDP